MSFNNLLIKESESIITVMINRPQALNAINSSVLDELEQVFSDTYVSDKIRGIILTGSGEKAFVAGADIKEIATLDKVGAAEFCNRGQSVFSKIENFKLPVIAAVNGFALGGGCELALSCDFILCSVNARFGLPEVSLGIIPGFGGTQRLPRRIGISKAREMIYSGKHYTSDEAFAMGLVNEVFEFSELMSQSQSLMEMISKQGPSAVSYAKRAINRGIHLSLEESMNVEREEFSNLFDTSDQKEGIQAFIEKRKPNFKGK